jgi:hypothetical protein
MSTIRFKLENIDFISQNFDSIDDLISNQSHNYDQGNNPKIKSIPMLLRRRLDTSDRFSVALGLNEINKISDHSKIAKIIYASRIGETIKCLSMLKSILNNEQLSPTDFSGSVQNANVGILSIASKFNGETSAIAAADSTFKSALIEAYITLKHLNNPEAKVIVVCYEGSLKNDLMEIDDPFDGPYALSMVLSLNDDQNLNNLVIHDDDLEESTALKFATNYQAFLK